MRSGTRALAAATILAAVAAFAPAHAAHDCTVAAGSAEHPHLQDSRDDWYGQLTTGELGAGDVWREGTDIVAAWFDRDEKGDVYANIQIAELTGNEMNAAFHLYWEHEDVEYFAGATIVRPGTRGPVVSYEYGHTEELPTGGSELVTSSSTGSIDPAAGIVRIKTSPKNQGALVTGDELASVTAQTSVLTGALGTGFYVRADATLEDGCTTITF